MSDTHQPAPVVQPQQGGSPVLVSQHLPGNGRGGTITTIASGITDAFKTSPVMLLIVLLNGAFIASAAYYLIQVESYRTVERQAIAAMLDKCIAQTVPVEYLLWSKQE